jgi:nucleoside-diphosphate-sugar epimerase
MRKPNRILVTGAKGQIGTELEAALKQRFGTRNVVTSDIVPPPDSSGCGTFYTVDITDKARLASIVKAERIDTIVHLAALLSWDSEKSPETAWNVNVAGTLNVLNLARDLDLTQVLLPSSIAVFGPDTPKVGTPTDTILKPTTLYGITKVTGELLGRYFVSKWGLDVRGLRYPGIVSHARPPTGGTTDWAVEMFLAAVKGQRYTCFVSRDTRLPMMYMPDCIKATLDLMTAPFTSLKHHADFNVSGMDFTAGELETAIQRHIPDFECDYRPDERQLIADAWPHSLDDSAARAEWGWRPSYNLDTMTSDMIEKLTSAE